MNSIETATFASSVFHLDAVERKPLYHFRPGSRLLTLAAPGCSFRCTYCINHRVSQYGREADVPWTARPVEPDEVVAEAARHGAGVAMSYTEPSLAIELTLALAEAGRGAGIPLVWKTNGFLTPEATSLVVPVLAAANVDLKAADEAAHRRLTGATLAPVIETIRRLVDDGVWVEVSTPVIPLVNSRPEQLARIAATLVAISPSIPWHLLRWTPGFRLTDGDPTSPAELEAARAIGHREGLTWVYVERALGTCGRRTGCPGCGRTLVERGIWSLESSSLYGGLCPGCGLRVPGRW